jgi:putative ABC transport system ATP-binding protein
MALVEINNLSKNYLMGEIEVQALREVSLSIEEAAFISFVGPSGSGKTTILNMIGCLDRPSEGEITIDGTRITGLDRGRSAEFRGDVFGFVFQSFNLFPVLTAYENVEYPLVMVKKEASSGHTELVMDLLRSVGMEAQKDKRPDQLSGGQRQRVAIARALVTRPKLVLADEPTANLDRKTAVNVIRLMKEMRDRFDTTFIFSTHDQGIMEEAEVIHALEDGRLVSSRTVQGERR